MLEILGNCSFGVRFSYYNPFVSTWEPIIEHTGFFLDFKIGSNTEIPFILLVELSEHSKMLNVNVSYQMLNVIEIARK